MARKLVIKAPDVAAPVLEQVLAENELPLQEQLKSHPELLSLGRARPGWAGGRRTPRLA